MTAPIVFSDVLLIYEYVHRTNGIKDGNTYVVSTLKKTQNINLNGIGKKRKQEIIKAFIEHCPQARFGYTAKNLKYIKTVRQSRNI